MVVEVFDDEAGEGEAEDGGGVGEGAVGSVGRALGLGNAFGGVDAAEFARGILFAAFEPLAQRAGEGAALHFPELGNGDLGGV